MWEPHEPQEPGLGDDFSQWLLQTLGIDYLSLYDQAQTNEILMSLSKVFYGILHDM